MSVLPSAIKVLAVKEAEDRRPKKRMVFVMAEDAFRFPIPIEMWPGGEATAASFVGKWLEYWVAPDARILVRPLRRAPRAPRKPEVTHLRCAECGYLMQGMENAFCGPSCTLHYKYARLRPPETILVETYALKRTRPYPELVKPFLAHQKAER